MPDERLGFFKLLSFSANLVFNCLGRPVKKMINPNYVVIKLYKNNIQIT